jgi:transcriptional regulator with GAF, ATPase, and Fis domain
MGLHSVPALGRGAIDRLLNYEWPGNVREVANVVERALIQSDGKTLFFDDVVPPQWESTTVDRMAGPTHEQGGTRQQKIPVEQPAHLRLEEVEARHIRRVMELSGGRIEGKNGAAILLGMNPATLRYRMQKLRIPFGRKKTQQDKENPQ